MKKLLTNALYLSCIVAIAFVVGHELYLSFGLEKEVKEIRVGAGGSVHRIVVREFENQRRYKTLDEMEWHVLDENNLLKDEKYRYLQPGDVIKVTLWR